MSDYNKTRVNYSEKLKFIRPFVDFNFDLRKKLTSAEKRKITIYFNEIDALTARPYHTYRSRDKRRLSKAQKYGQHEKVLKDLNTAFIPTSGQDIRLTFDKNNNIKVISKHVRSSFIEFDPLELAWDPYAYTNESIKKNKKAKAFTVLAGRYEIPQVSTRALIADTVNNLCAKYSEDTKNNYFGNWLIGLNAHEFKEQDDIFSYMKDKEKAKSKIKKLKKKNKKGKK